MSFDNEKALLRAHPNCRHCHGRGSVMRSHPHMAGKHTNWLDYCRCVTKRLRESLDLAKPIEVFVIGDGTNG
jgi:hypothetical protein